MKGEWRVSGEGAILERWSSLVLVTSVACLFVLNCI